MPVVTPNSEIIKIENNSILEIKCCEYPEKPVSCKGEFF